MNRSRRSFVGQLLGAGGSVSFGLFILRTSSVGAANVPKTQTPSLPDVEKWRHLSERDWAARVTANQFKILRKEGTERAYSSPLNREKRAGTYHCAGCDLSLFSSETKYDSRTGWPSFWSPVDNTHVATRTDYRLIWPRTEVHCARCLGHLGHVFKDGPAPTGLRYCLNGLALTFHPKT